MPKNAEVSALDNAARNYKDLTNEVVNQGGDGSEMHRIHSDRDLRRQLAALIVGSSSTTGTVVGSFELTIDHHSRSVEEMVAAGRYDGYTNPNITTENFPHHRDGIETVTIDLVQFSQTGTTTERQSALAAYDDLCDMDDQLAFGVSNPDEQRQHPIVFLGAVWVDPYGYRYVGCLWSHASLRHCDLLWGSPDGRWNPRCVFAVRRRK